VLQLFVYLISEGFSHFKFTSKNFSLYSAYLRTSRKPLSRHEAPLAAKGQQKKTEMTHKGPSAAKPQPKKKQDIHHGGREDPSAAEPQPKESEYLPQRRKGAK
jgi:hypothetical protein